jgi:gamma-glutamyl-gamma-aminobutyraldehyde dehydrogenase
MNQSQIDALRHEAIADASLMIDGQWVQAADGATLASVSPIDGQVLCHIASASTEDVDCAVTAARRSFDKGSWSRQSPAERKKTMHRIADVIEGHQLELAVLGVRDNGTEISMALKAEPGSAASTFRFYAEAIDKSYGEIAPTAQNVMGLIHREPVGVVGVIVPWNFPLMIGAWKVAAALAAGNSVVLKPSEEASLSWLRVAQLCHEAGLPPGVLNVITGLGSTAGNALARHMSVDVLSFTGSGAVGRSLLQASAESNLKRVYLELGGKSPNIVFEDAPDLDAAVKTSVQGIFRNSGQVCVAGSRLLVQRSIADEFVSKFASQANALRVGDPLDLSSEVGAVSNSKQLARNTQMLQNALGEGARLRAGGAVIEPVKGGYYMQPTVLDQVRPDMRIAQEEVFGPVLTVMIFDDEQQAISMANDSTYGLAAGVWTSNLSRAHRMVREIQAGVVHVNTYGGPDITVPLGGVKQSGSGPDKSLHALSKYQNLKTAWVQL